MRITRFAVVVALALSLALRTVLAVPTAGPVPVKDLFRDYDYGSMSMSPDGTTLVTVYPVEWEKGYFYALASLNLDTGQSKILHLNRRIPIERVEWVGMNRLLVSVFGWNTSQNWARQAGLFSFDADGGRPAEIVKPGDVSALFGTITNNPRNRLQQVYSVDWPEVISWQASTSEEVLVAQRKFGDRFERARRWANDGAPPLPGVYRVNIFTGKYSLHVADPGWTAEWFADPAGRIRLAAGFNRAEFTDDGRWIDRKKLPAMKVYWFDDAGRAEEVTAIGLRVDDAFTPLGFEPGGKRFLFSGRQGRDMAAVYAYNPATKAVEGPLVENERVEIDASVVSPHDQTVAGVVVHDGLPRVVWLDPRLKALQPSVDAALPGFHNRMTGWTKDYQRVLIRSVSSQELGRYFLLDRKNGKLTQVYQRAGWLQEAKFGETRPVQLAARDGVPLHGYLTRPPGVADSVATPLVLLVHGGPWTVRDYAEFNPEVQFYATRGYSVLQVNYRRSAGYGRKFEELGHRQFGRTMQSDLDDAVDWAVAQGYADPKRLIIAGSSYGGYATLMGLVQHPERFRAGIAMFPVTDLIQQIEDYETEGKEESWSTAPYAHEIWRQRVGDPVADRALLEENSPNHQVARIKAPVFLVYGPKDEIIDKQQVKKFIGRMKAQKKTLVHFAPREEGHGISDEERRLQVYTALEKFLQQYAPAN